MGVLWAHMAKIDRQTSGGNSSPDSSSLTFTCFPDLPMEIRKSIWGYGACFPRNLDILAEKFGTLSCCENDNGMGHNTHYSDSSPPNDYLPSCRPPESPALKHPDTILPHSGPKAIATTITASRSVSLLGFTSISKVIDCVQWDAFARILHIASSGDLFLQAR
jgi:hypothetical protein